MRLRALVVWSVAMLAQPPLALAFDAVPGNPILDRFNIDVGTFYYGTGTTITLNGTYGQRGVPINLEHDLGLKDVNRFRLDAYWRITKHQRLRILYFQADRRATRSIDRTIQYGNATYPVNTTIAARNIESIAALGYEYDFFVRDHVSIGANIGIHNLKFDLGLTGTAATSGGAHTAGVSQSASADGPLPLIGLAGIFRVNPWLYFTATVQGLKVKVNPYSGSLWDVGGTMVWQPFRHFGIGAGYDFFRLSADVNKPSFNGSLTWRYSGPRVFFSGSF
jgi:hypothetical protein